MPRVKQFIDEINGYLACWISKIEVSNASSYYDINKVSEGVSLQLFNLIYGYQLVNMNDARRNFPGIDLGDKTSGKLAIQITSRTDSNKIKSTLLTFVERDYFKEFPNGIRFFLLSESRRPVLSEKILRPFAHFFEPKRDIILIRDLLQQIEKLYYEDPAHFETVRQFLKQEFGIVDSLPKHDLINFEHQGDKISFYKKLFIAHHQYETQYFVPIHYKSNDQEFLTDRIHQELLNSNGLIVYGSSGCGKSMLARKLAVELIDIHFPIFLEMKYYDNDFVKLFNKEINAYGFQSESDFFDCLLHSGQQGRTVFVIICRKYSK